MSDTRSPKLLKTDEAAAYMGVDRLDRLPPQFRPTPLAYGKGLYHVDELDRCIEAAKTRQDKRPRLQIGGS